MMQALENSIIELPATTSTFTIGNITTDSCNSYPYNGYTVWNNYPVYICTDKTKKAIEILKALQAEKLLECKSVPRFIELVDKISNLL